MKCPVCGSEEREGALYCGMCKAVFAKVTAAPVAAQIVEPAIHASWHRREMFIQPGAPGTILFVLYASFKNATPIVRSKYRVPAGVRSYHFGREDQRFAQGFELAAGEMLARHPDAALAARRAQTAVVIEGELVDAPDLLDLRRVLGLVSATLAASAITTAAVYDPAQLRWWTRHEWETTFADGAPFSGNHHVRVGRRGTDLVTCGVGKFGRPDIMVSAQDPAFAGQVLEVMIDSALAGAPIAPGPIEIAGRTMRLVAHAAQTPDNRAGCLALRESGS